MPARSGWRTRSPSRTNRPPGANTARTSGVCSSTTWIATQHRLLAAGRGDALVGAAAAAGISSSRHGFDPKRPCTAASPATTPGTAQAAAPMWNTWVVCSSNGTSTASGSPSGRSAGRSRPGMAVNASSRCTLRVRAGRTSRKPPPHGLISPGSAAHDIAAAATVASTALPPSARTAAAVRAVCSCPAAAAALMPESYASLLCRWRMPVPGRAARSDISRSRRPRSAPCASAR